MTQQEVYLVQSQEGDVLAAFTDRDVAGSYAAARAGRTVTTTPLLDGAVSLTTVHTRWVETDNQGVLQAHAHETYGWCPELDGQEGAPPVAEVEHYRDGTRHRLLGVGTDLARVDEQLRQSLPGDENVPSVL